MTSRRFGVFCMGLGALLLVSAALLMTNNHRQETYAGQTAETVLEKMQETLLRQDRQLILPGETPAPEMAESADTRLPQQAAEDTPRAGATPVPDMPIMTIDGQEYIGYLELPTLDLSLPVMSQWSYAGLKIAPGRYSGSTYADNMVVCAHNYAKHFSPIKWLTEGAQVYFTDMDGMRWTYEVSYVENLQPTQIEEMTEKTEESDEWDLTLFTCTTGGSARCAVRCVRTGYPALTTETAE